MPTREERAETTRAQLLDIAAELFASRGYAEVGTEDVVRQAGLTRGALYHHFADKRELFAAVHERVEQELVAAIGERMAAARDTATPVELLIIGMRAFLDACVRPAVLRISLLDGPTVLGWARWREVGERYGLGLVIGGLEFAMQAGELRRQDVRPLAHLLLAALSEAAQLIAHAEHPEQARAEVEPAMLALVNGLRP
ncbi:MAG TPA: helix-turn-helix domain-containing protein [Pseudonocardia sp.]|uniref:TetR/AcrR family transcriptional regulator n=1 Tax=Pseudonocardia sp. TaxID=60912 RepID=UPI002D0E6EF0|nr:helix-turn-helix domain-containing protein [Pseudonocardia sp.]HTF53247.1 helix-turn-helix domain-containing protein [Pseudonocardia sp.]